MSDRKPKAKERKAAVLSRYPGQRILIGDSTVVRVVKIEGQRVFVFVETNDGFEIGRPSKEEDQADKENGKEQKNQAPKGQVK